MMVRCNIYWNAATFAANQNFNVHVERTNNTPAALAQPAITYTMPIITTRTENCWFGFTGIGLYTTANSNDAFDCYGSVTLLPSAGSISVNSLQLLIMRLY